MLIHVGVVGTNRVEGWPDNDQQCLRHFGFRSEDYFPALRNIISERSLIPHRPIREYDRPTDQPFRVGRKRGRGDQLVISWCPAGYQLVMSL